MQNGNRNIRLLKALILVPLCWAHCTNYSAETQNINPPIILTVTAEGTGHILTVAAQNAELGFFGYRLFQAPTEAGVRALNPTAGTDCGALAAVPNQAINYVLEAKPGQTAPSLSDTDVRICAFPVQLTSGSYIAVRALGFSITTVNTSEISNAVIVP